MTLLHKLPSINKRVELLGYSSQSRSHTMRTLVLLLAVLAAAFACPGTTPQVITGLPYFKKLSRHFV